MFTNRKAKSVVAAISAIIALTVNTAASFAAPFAYGNAEEARKKAIGDYFSSVPVVVAGASVSQTEKTAVGSLVTYEEITETVAVGFNTIKRVNYELQAGSTSVVREGENGEKTISYKVKYENGKEVSREVVSEVVTKAPVDKIVEYGNTKTETQPQEAKKSFSYKYYIDCKATAYDLSPEENGGFGGQTATGVPLDKGVIAVDPRVIPLGTRVYIEAIDGSWSYGYAVAADTGGAIKGKRVDLCYRTRSECIQFGVRPCRVYVLD